MTQGNTRKTYKREMAFLLFMGLAYVVYDGNVEMAEILVWPTFTFGALAFGLDWAGKSGISMFKPGS